MSAVPLIDFLRQTLLDRLRALLNPGDLLLVAVSGGPDSLSLLHALHSLSPEIGLRGLHAAHFDHGLRGAESVADAEFVSDFCLNSGIAAHIGRGDVAARAHNAKTSKQIAARLARYEFLDEIASQIGADKIATAHTKDDQIETILLNILRGTGLQGLRGIPTQRGRYVRPMLTVSRADVLTYCDDNGLSPREDVSNKSTAYTRNRLRLGLLPQLAREYNPAVGEALLRLGQIAERDADYLRREAERILPALTMADEPSRLVLDAAKLRALHPSMLRHVLRAAMLQRRGTLDGIAHDHIEPLCAAVLGQRTLPFGFTTPAPHCAIRVAPRRVTLTALTYPTTPAATP